MKTALVVQMLQKQLEDNPNEEIIIQWWRQEDMDMYEKVTPNIWKMMVELWDNEPLTAQQAGLWDIFTEAKERVAVARRAELNKRFEVIHGTKD